MEQKAVAAIRGFVERSPELALLRQVLEPGEKCHLVGGLLRDLIQGRPSLDLDLAIPGDAVALSQRVAQALHGRWFVMDKERGHSRIAVHRKGANVILDIAPYRAPDLGSDLAARDFTLNALAWPLHSAPDEAVLVDPLGGLKDLDRKVLRRCSIGSFQDDPLRVLRGVRLVLQCDLSFEADTFELMKAATPRLTGVAQERILTELGKIFSTPRAICGLELLGALGGLEILFGLPAGDKGGMFRGLRMLKRLEIFLAALSWPFFFEELEAGWSGAALMRLGAWLRGYGVDSGRGEIRRFPFSRRSQRLLAEWLLISEDCLNAYRNLTCSGRGRAQWLGNLGGAPCASLLFAALLSKESFGLCGPLLAGSFSLWKAYAKQGRVPPLVRGEELVRLFQVSPGTQIGRLLQELAEEETKGKICSRFEALAWLRQRLEMD